MTPAAPAAPLPVPRGKIPAYGRVRFREILGDTRAEVPHVPQVPKLVVNI